MDLYDVGTNFPKRVVQTRPKRIECISNGGPTLDIRDSTGRRLRWSALYGE